MVIFTLLVFCINAFISFIIPAFTIAPFISIWINFVHDWTVLTNCCISILGRSDDGCPQMNKNFLILTWFISIQGRQIINIQKLYQRDKGAGNQFSVYWRNDIIFRLTTPRRDKGLGINSPFSGEMILSLGWLLPGETRGWESILRLVAKWYYL